MSSTVNGRSDVRTRAWEAVRDRIRSWPYLKTMGVLFQAPEDAGFDDPAPAQRTTVRMAPKYGPMVPLATNGLRHVYEAPLLVTFEVTASGMHAESSHQVWYEIEAALSGSDLDDDDLAGYQAWMREIGLNDVVLTTPTDSLAGGSVGEGSVSCSCFVTR